MKMRGLILPLSVLLIYIKSPSDDVLNGAWAYRLGREVRCGRRPALQSPIRPFVVIYSRVALYEITDRLDSSSSAFLDADNTRNQKWGSHLKTDDTRNTRNGGLLPRGFVTPHNVDLTSVWVTIRVNQSTILAPIGCYFGIIQPISRDRRSGRNPASARLDPTESGLTWRLVSTNEIARPGPGPRRPSSARSTAYPLGGSQRLSSCRSGRGG